MRFILFTIVLLVASPLTRANQDQAPSNSLLSGYFIGPPGMKVVIQKDGVTDLELVAKVDGSKVMKKNHFPNLIS